MQRVSRPLPSLSPARALPCCRGRPRLYWPSSHLITERTWPLWADKRDGLRDTRLTQERIALRGLSASGVVCLSKELKHLGDQYGQRHNKHGYLCKDDFSSGMFCKLSQATLIVGLDVTVELGQESAYKVK
jgi:hypothetical protein